MLPHYHISISRFYPIIWSHWSVPIRLHPSSPPRLTTALISHVDMEIWKGPRSVSSGQQCSGGAGAVTDRDVVWGRSASWSPQITMFWLVTRCNTLSRGVTGTNIIVMSPVYIMCQYLQTTCWVWAVHLGTSAWEEYTHWRYTKLTLSLSGTFKELL